MTAAEYRLRVLLLLASVALVAVCGVVLASSALQALLLLLVVAGVCGAGLALLWAQRYPELARAWAIQVLARLGGRG